SSAIFASLALTTALGIASVSRADGPKKAAAPQKVLGATPIAGAALLIDRVKVVDFTASPSPPRVGDRVTLTVTIRNLLNTPLDVPWSIRNVGQGTVRVGASAETTVTAYWTPTFVGGAFLEVELDPQNTLNEPPPARENNKRSIEPYVQPYVITLKPDF